MKHLLLAFITLISSQAFGGFDCQQFIGFTSLKPGYAVIPRPQSASRNQAFKYFESPNSNWVVAVDKASSLANALKVNFVGDRLEVLDGSGTARGFQFKDNQCANYYEFKKAMNDKIYTSFDLQTCNKYFEVVDRNGLSQQPVPRNSMLTRGVMKLAPKEMSKLDDILDGLVNAGALSATGKPIPNRTQRKGLNGLPSDGAMAGNYLFSMCAVPLRSVQDLPAALKDKCQSSPTECLPTVKSKTGQ